MEKYLRFDLTCQGVNALYVGLSTIFESADMPWHNIADTKGI